MSGSLGVLTDWFRRLRESAVRIAELADYVGHPSDPTFVLERTLEKPELLAVLGAPGARVTDGVPGSRDAPYTQWLHAIWGRRCGIYFFALAKGLRASTKVQKEERVEKLADRIDGIASTFGEAFRRQRLPLDTLRNALLSGHGITPFHVTYLDPTLFSGLMLLQRVRTTAKLVGSNRDRWESTRNGDMGIKSDKEAEDVCRQLVELIRDEVNRYVRVGKSPALADDSTLWWAVTELIELDKDRFVVGKYHGRHGAAELCHKLADWTVESPAQPHFGMALSEATPEIHSELRTKLLVLQNALRILQHDWPPSERSHLQPVLTRLCGSLVERVQGYPGTNVVNGRERVEHAYFSGLGLEVASSLMLSAKILGLETSPPVEPTPTAENRWTEWAPLTSHGKALNMDYRKFQNTARESWNLERHPDGGNRYRFDKTKMPTLERTRYEQQFELPRRERSAK
jgi:hypothetical protein